MKIKKIRYKNEYGKENATTVLTDGKNMWSIRLGTKVEKFPEILEEQEGYEMKGELKFK